MIKKADVHGGNYYARDPVNGRLVPHAPGVPDVWICRRVADYPPAPVPVGAGFATCSRCGAAIAYNPARTRTVPATTPKVCMQCAGVEPLPITS